MITATIEETNHKLDDVIKNQQASQATVSLLEQFVNKIDATLKAQGKPVFFRTHKYGVTGSNRSFIENPRSKAFIYIDIRQNYISTKYFTGNGSIEGLRKANWLNKGDNKGSERIRISDVSEVEKAVEFACAAYKIAY